MILAGRRINDNMGIYVAQRDRTADDPAAHPGERRAHAGAGATFKENCPDVRNTQVVDVVRELEKYGAKVDVYDPWVDADEAEHEYGLAPVKKPSTGIYDAIVIGVAHTGVPRAGHRQDPRARQEEPRALRHQVRVRRRRSRRQALDHEDPGHRRRRLHRLSHGDTAARARRRGRRPRQSQRLLRRPPEARAPGAARARSPAFASSSSTSPIAPA